MGVFEIPMQEEIRAMSNITKSTLNSKSPEDRRLSPTALRAAVEEHCQSLLDVVESAAESDADEEPVSFGEFEQSVCTELWTLGALLLRLFLELTERSVRQRLGRRVVRDGHTFKRHGAKARSLKTLFSVIRYWRTYMYRTNGGGGYYPVDSKLGLTGDRFSFNLLMLSARLACMLSFAKARETLQLFVPSAPSTEVMEQAVLGLGRYTQDFFEQAPPPDVDGPDGEVLVIMVDSKGIPTATAQELQRRRGPRTPRQGSPSRRHRGRQKRHLYGSKPKRKPGDKSKNAKMGTMVVMYTLHREGDRLVGPRNIFRYASMAPKRHAFDVALREAKKRGFQPDDKGLFNNGDRQIQIVIDGDPNLRDYAAEYFPDVVPTLDLIHLLEYVWSAGNALSKYRGQEMDAWYDLQKHRIFGGDIDDLIKELCDGLDKLPRSGPGTKGRRKTLESAIEYITKRKEMLHYKRLIDEDLELATGAVEGAIKHVMAKRFDSGGMRWIRQRAEALLQLRCIEINGQWDDFASFVHQEIGKEQQSSIARIQQSEPEELPQLQELAA
jgi:hypothetical protein